MPTNSTQTITEEEAEYLKMCIYRFIREKNTDRDGDSNDFVTVFMEAMVDQIVDSKLADSMRTNDTADDIYNGDYTEFIV